MQLEFDRNDGMMVQDAWLPARRARRRRTYKDGLKRWVDVLLALPGILGTLPIWLLIAVAIKLDSPGPVFFVQERMGLHGRRFKFFKFRSMYDGADAHKHELAALNDVTGPVFKIRKDPRITPVGRLLRRTSLDELPQLLNVLLGDMSLVGPRPALPDEVAGYQPADHRRFTVKPGITCFWQISGRSNCTFEQWMEFDRQYVDSVSLLVDLGILVRTVGAVLSCRGAY